MQFNESHIMTRKSENLPTKGPRLVMEATDLAAVLEDTSTRIVDLRPDTEIADGFIAGSVRLDYGKLVRRQGKVEGLLPTDEALAGLLGELDISPGQRVVALDMDSGIRATRLLWTLAVCGHSRYSLLNGGFTAWKNAGLPIVPMPQVLDSGKYPGKYRGQYPLQRDQTVVADLDYMLDSLDCSDRQILDVRSAEEYAGTSAKADRGGHIPGAVHYEWLNVLEEDKRLRSAHSIRGELQALGVTPDQEIIPYCQSNRRSAHAYIVLKWLGYSDVRAYQGSWSEWGNVKDTPVEP
jgi:thiosulfate/3-mercaptopyruvate sulfurtransferase